MNENLDEYLKTIYSEMCRRVGTTLAEVDLTDNNWYQKYQWPIKEEINFRDWLVQYLEKNPEAKQAIIKQGIIKKNNIKQMATDFACYYGWDHLIETEQTKQS